jgi:hypothetical protein
MSKTWRVDARDYGQSLADFLNHLEREGWQVFAITEGGDSYTVVSWREV